MKNIKYIAGFVTAFSVLHTSFAWAQSAEVGAGDANLLSNEFVFYGLCGLVIFNFFVSVLVFVGAKSRHAKLEKYVKQTFAKQKAHEEKMRQREKFVLAAMLQKEIQDNKDKTEAFIIINRDLLQGIKSAQAKTMLHRYQQSGEMLQKMPALNRDVFETNSNRFDLLEPDLVQGIVNLYAGIESDPEYITLTQETPLHEAMNHVQKTILEAEKLIEPFDKLNAALSIILDETKRRKIYKSARPF